MSFVNVCNSVLMRPMLTHGTHLLCIISCHFIDYVNISWWMICSTHKEQKIVENYYIGTSRLSLLLSCTFSLFWESLCNIFHFLFYFNPAVTKREWRWYLFGLESTVYETYFYPDIFSDEQWVTHQWSQSWPSPCPEQNCFLTHMHRKADRNEKVLVGTDPH